MELSSDEMSKIEEVLFKERDRELNYNRIEEACCGGYCSGHCCSSASSNN